MDFLVFGFLDFYIFCVLHLCFQSVETAPKLDSEAKGVCIGIYSVLKGLACRRGVTIYIYIYIHIDVYMCMCICVCAYVFLHTYIYIYVYM